MDFLVIYIMKWTFGWMEMIFVMNWIEFELNDMKLIVIWNGFEMNWNEDDFELNGLEINCTETWTDVNESLNGNMD